MDEVYRNKECESFFANNDSHNKINTNAKDFTGDDSLSDIEHIVDIGSSQY